MNLKHTFSHNIQNGSYFFSTWNKFQQKDIKMQPFLYLLQKYKEDKMSSCIHVPMWQKKMVVLLHELTCGNF